MAVSTFSVYPGYVPEGLLAVIVVAGAMYLLTSARRRTPAPKKPRRSRAA